MKTEQKEIVGTVLSNEKMTVVMIGGDGRMYRHTYHRGTAYMDLVDGDVVKIYYTEPAHNEIHVYGMDMERPLPIDEEPDAA